MVYLSLNIKVIIKVHLKYENFYTSKLFKSDCGMVLILGE